MAHCSPALDLLQMGSSEAAHHGWYLVPQARLRATPSGPSPRKCSPGYDRSWCRSSSPHGSKPGHDGSWTAEQGSPPYFLEAEEPAPQYAQPTVGQAWRTVTGLASLFLPDPQVPQVLSSNLTFADSFPQNKVAQGESCLCSLPCQSLMQALMQALLSDSQVPVHFLFDLPWIS